MKTKILADFEICISVPLNFYFHLLRGASKDLMKALKAFEPPQRSVKIKL